MGREGHETHQARTIGLDDLGMELMYRHRSAVDSLANSLDLQALPDGFVFKPLTSRRRTDPA
jgi:hypothetical protein